MYDYEAQFESFEISGAPVMICDICGVPISESIYLTSGRGSSPAVADRLLRVCEGCFADIGGGDIQVFTDGSDLVEFYQGA